MIDVYGSARAIPARELKHLGIASYFARDTYAAVRATMDEYDKDALIDAIFLMGGRHWPLVHEHR